MTRITQERGFGRDELAGGALAAGSWARGRPGVLALSGLALALVACAAPQREAEPVDTSELVWPLPPDNPRVKFVRAIRTASDIGARKTLSVVDALVGESDDLRQGLELPYAVHADKEGRVFVADVGLDRVVVLDIPAKKLLIWGDSGRGALVQPAGISSDSQGRIYVTDANGQRVVIYDRDGNFSAAFGKKGELERPVGIAVNEALGRIYVVDRKKHQIAVFGMDGQQMFTIGKPGSEPGQFNGPTHLAMDRGGNLYVTDAFNFRVQVLDPDGQFLKTIGKIGDSRGNFARPKGVAVDSEGNIYVVDAAFNNIQVFNQGGDLLMFMGVGGINLGQYWLPSGAYIDDQDRIYIADQFNARVQILQRLAGEGGASQASGAEPGESEANTAATE
jgi:DNA-binding beta-propeller fold protein YncE